MSLIHPVTFNKKPPISVILKAAQIPRKHLVGYWMFSENGGNKVFDKSGNGNHGTIHGNPVWTGGKFGPALDFDGDGDYVEISNPGNILDGKHITVTAWVKPDSSLGNSYPRIIDRVYNGQFVFYLDARSGHEGDVGVALDVTGTDVDNPAICDQVYTTDEWQFLVFTYNGETITSYRNGISCGTDTTPSGALDTSTDNIRIGERVDAGDTRCFNGLIDNVMIFDRALSAAEIRRLYYLFKSCLNV